MPFKKLLIIVSLFASKWSVGQRNDDVINYINTYKDLAIHEMQRSGIPASIILAQGIHETMAGKSDLVLKSNNHFGIKCKDNWLGDKVYHDDDATQECFRSYSSPADSYADHSDFLKNSPRYAFLFKLDPEDYKGWAFGLKKAGYATNNAYSQILIKLIEDYNLEDYTLIALGKLPSQQIEVIAGPSAPGVAANTSTGFQEKKQPIVSNKPVYPETEFAINRTRVIFAKSGTALLSVARQYDVSLARLLDFNDMLEEEVLTEDQLLFLQRKRKIGANEFHTVQPGEGLYDICQSEGVRMESLLEYNHLERQDQPAVGEKIYLQASVGTRPKLTSEVMAVSTNVETMGLDSAVTTAASANTHIVQNKETLYSIAKKYGVSIQKLRDWNRLGSKEVRTGQELIIHKD